MAPAVLLSSLPLISLSSFMHLIFFIILFSFSRHHIHELCHSLQSNYIQALCLSASLSKRTFVKLLLQNDYGLHKCLIEVQNLSSHLDPTHSHSSLLILSSQCFRTPSHRRVKKDPYIMASGFTSMLFISSSASSRSPALPSTTTMQICFPFSLD